jgi:hypothetical protein
LTQHIKQKETGIYNIREREESESERKDSKGVRAIEMNIKKTT